MLLRTESSVLRNDEWIAERDDRKQTQAWPQAIRHVQTILQEDVQVRASLLTSNYH